DRTARNLLSPAQGRRRVPCRYAGRPLDQLDTGCWGGGSPAKESTTHTRRCLTPYAFRTARMKIVAPPRQTPVSMRSPGTFLRSTSSIHSCRLSSLFRPIIVWAPRGGGQSRPSTRTSGSNPSSPASAWIQFVKHRFISSRYRAFPTSPGVTRPVRRRRGEIAIITSRSFLSLRVVRSGRTPSQPQVEDDQAVVREEAAELRVQVPTQSGVVVEPPEGRPGEHDEPGA